MLAIVQPIRAAMAVRTPDVQLIEPGYLASTEIFSGLWPHPFRSDHLATRA
jgi:hypothetical protein